MQTLISKIGSQQGKLISSVHIKELEEWINDYTSKLPPVEHFIIPVSFLIYLYSDNLANKYTFTGVCIEIPLGLIHWLGLKLIFFRKQIVLNAVISNRINRHIR